MIYELVTMYKDEEIRRTTYAREFDMLCAQARLEAAGYRTYVVIVTACGCPVRIEEGGTEHQDHYPGCSAQSNKSDHG